VQWELLTGYNFEWPSDQGLFAEKVLNSQYNENTLKMCNLFTDNLQTEVIIKTVSHCEYEL